MSLLVTVLNRLQNLNWRTLLNVRMLGFALARAWVYLMFLGAGVSCVTWNGSQVPDVIFLWSSIALTLTLFASALAHKWFSKAVQLSSFKIAGPAMTSVGTLLIASCMIPGVSQFILGGFGALLTGIGSGLIDLGYGELYRNIEPEKTVFEVPFAFCVAAAFLPLVSLLSSVMVCTLCAVLPLVSGWILFYHLKVWKPQATPKVPPIEINMGKFAWRIGACACLIGLADGVVRAIFIQASETTLDSFYRFPLFWASVITLIVIYGCTLFSKHVGLRPVYKSTVLVMALFFMLLPVFTGHIVAESVIALTGYGTFNVLIWLLLAGIAFRFRFSAIEVFGIGWGMVTLGVLLGSYTGQLLCRFAPFSPQQVSLIALLSTLAILVSYMFVFKESDLIKLTQAESSSPSQQHASPKRSFQKCCQDVAKEYQLTPKETEIMILFAKGRSSARIQEDLFLSRGTVTTHLRHIYQKMDVHSKQEFLDVIEGRKAAHE